jgi:2,3-bisphosphoglycerate-dependent phosphoglycerate mutase
MKKLVLLRHGQSAWNLENRFTGWTDVDLSDAGRQEAAAAGQLMKAHGFQLDYAFTSVLKRAIRTLWIALDEMDQLWIPTEKSWLLNERHYGALQGLNKAETAQKYGDEQVHIWRRSFAVCPPALETSDNRHPANDPRYKHLAPNQCPGTESLAITLERVFAYWDQAIAPALTQHNNIIIAAHGNSLRALVKHLDKLSDEQIMGVEIPTGQPLVYELNPQLGVVDKYYLKDK